MASLAENILKEIQETASERKDEAVGQHQELLATIQNSTLSVDDIGTKVKDAAEAEAAAIVESEKIDKAKADADRENDIANRGVLEKIHGSLSSGFSQLGGAIKSDFSMLMAPLTLMAQSPGMKTVITILKVIGMWLAKLFLHLITKKLFSGLRAEDAGSLDVKETVDNFKKWGKSLVFGRKADTPDRLSKGDREKKDDKLARAATATKPAIPPVKPAVKQEKVLGRKPIQERIPKGQKGGGQFMKAPPPFSKKVLINFKLARRSLLKFSRSFVRVMKRLPGKSIKLFRMAAMAVSLTFLKMTKALMKFVKRMIPILISFAVAVGLFLASMLMSVMALIAPAIPYILIGIAIALLVAGLIWLGMKIVENWDRIKERFIIAMHQLGIWAEKAALWLGNAIAPLRDKLALFFAAILDGVANMVNSAIGWINSHKPDWVPGGELIDFKMDGGNVEKAQEGIKIRASERSTKADEIDERQAALDDRKARYDTGGESPAVNTSQQNVVVNNQNTSKHIATSTQPTDQYAGNMALAQ